MIDTRNKIHESIIPQIEKSIGEEHIFKESIKYFADIPKGIEEKKFMVDITNNDIDKTIKLITEEFKVRVERI